MESANERVLELMDKHARKSVIENNLREAANAGIWNHVMAFYGFPGETREEAEETRQFLIDNKTEIHSVELFYFVAYRHTPMVRNPDKFGITIQKQDEYDMPLDYYYTLNEPGSLSCLDAMQLCEEFYQNDFEPWAVRINAREQIFLYISRFGTNRLPQIYATRHSPCRRRARYCGGIDHVAGGQGGPRRRQGRGTGDDAGGQPFDHVGRELTGPPPALSVLRLRCRYAQNERESGAEGSGRRVTVVFQILLQQFVRGLHFPWSSPPLSCTFAYTWWDCWSGSRTGADARSPGVPGTVGAASWSSAVG